MWPAVQIYDPGGTKLCDANSSSSAVIASCILSAGGTYSILVFDNYGVDSGNYYVYLQRLNYPGTPVSFSSTGAYDGWILESTETSTMGGTLNATATTFNLGDGVADKQYRAILSFNTAGIQTNAIITRITLKIRKQTVVGTDPFTILGGLKVDIRKPFFGTTVGLVISDFQAAVSRAAVGTFSATPVSNWYSAVIGSAGYPYINRTGTTQFRLYFTRDDNDDNGADYMKFFSGNYGTASLRPTLTITYYVP
jgi:hypothetical protein